MSTIVRVELAEPTEHDRMIGKRLIIENQFEHWGSERVEAGPEELGLVEYGKQCSTAITAILANGNIRMGVCNIGDTARLEIVPARYAQLELKLGSEVIPIDHVTVLPQTTGEIWIYDYGETLESIYSKLAKQPTMTYPTTKPSAITRLKSSWAAWRENRQRTS